MKSYSITNDINNKLVIFLKKRAVTVLLLAFIVFMVISKPSFYSWGNITNILTEMSVYGIVAFAMTVAIIGGEFDLSASSIFGWATVFFISITNTLGLIPAFFLTLISGILMGMVNGFLVSKVKLNAFVVTLATMTIIKGLTFFYTGGSPINTSNETLIAIGAFNVAGITLTPIIFVIALIVFILILAKTRFGRNIYATGGNYHVAKLTGINVDYYKFIIFVIVGFCSALAGILLCVRVQAGSALYGKDLALYAVTATVIGGTSLSGGNGGVAKTVIGLLVMSVLFNALTLLGVEGYFQQLIRGIVLIAVIIIDTVIKKKNK